LRFYAQNNKQLFKLFKLDLAPQRHTRRIKIAGTWFVSMNSVSFEGQLATSSCQKQKADRNQIVWNSTWFGFQMVL